MANMYQIHRQFFDAEELNKEIPRNTKPVPSWLGNFTFSIFGNVYGKKTTKLSPKLQDLVLKLAALHPEQEFNTTFLQVYKTGTKVRKHRDPKNNIGYTIIAVFGEFQGAMTTLHTDHERILFTLRPGDVLSLACTIDGVQGVPHEVSEVISGTRCALILNTIEQKVTNPPKFIDETFS